VIRAQQPARSRGAVTCITQVPAGEITARGRGGGHPLVLRSALASIHLAQYRRSRTGRAEISCCDHEVRPARIFKSSRCSEYFSGVKKQAVDIDSDVYLFPAGPVGMLDI